MDNEIRIELEVFWGNSKDVATEILAIFNKMSCATEYDESQEMLSVKFNYQCQTLESCFTLIMESFSKELAKLKKLFQSCSLIRFDVVIYSDDGRPEIFLNKDIVHWMSELYADISIDLYAYQ